MVFICYSTFSSAIVPAFGFFICVFSLICYSVFSNKFSVSAISFQFQQYKLYPNGYYGSVWVQIILHLHFQWFFFSFFAAHVSGDKVIVHALFMGPSITLLKKNIKNWSHGTIHEFKNYFATVFSIFSKISCIQTDPISLSSWN